MTQPFRVDKGRFLALAAALASAATFQACSATDSKPAGAGGGISDGGRNAAGALNEAGSKSEAGSTSDSGAAGALGVAGAGGASEGGAAQGGASEGGAAGAAQAGATEGGAGGAAACVDTAELEDCSAFTGTQCAHYCAAARANLKPAAANSAIDCLALDDTTNCDTGYACLADATASGCAEDVTAACTAAAVDCTSSDAADPPCEQLLSGLNTAARAEAITCMAESCFSVYSCAEGLFFQ